MLISHGCCERLNGIWVMGTVYDDGLVVLLDGGETAPRELRCDSKWDILRCILSTVLIWVGQTAVPFLRRPFMTNFEFVLFNVGTWVTGKHASGVIISFTTAFARARFWP